jgi:hypothetical protein
MEKSKQPFTKKMEDKNNKNLELLNQKCKILLIYLLTKRNLKKKKHNMIKFQAQKLI